MELDLVTANKQMTEILELFKNSNTGDFVMHEQFYRGMTDKALQIVELYKRKGQ
jgi:hypothetical protein